MKTFKQFTESISGSLAAKIWKKYPNLPDLTKRVKKKRLYLEFSGTVEAYTGAPSSDVAVPITGYVTGMHHAMGFDGEETYFTHDMIRFIIENMNTAERDHWVAFTRDADETQRFKSWFDMTDYTVHILTDIKIKNPPVGIIKGEPVWIFADGWGWSDHTSSYVVGKLKGAHHG